MDALPLNLPVLQMICPVNPAMPKRQFRAMWVASMANIDWPSRPGLDLETVQAEYRALLDLAVRFHHNAIVVQIRPSADTFWPSPYEPWSQWLTGRSDGASPGWDPLAFLITESHARNLEFHAWFNPYRASSPQFAGPDLAKLPPGHPLRRHPHWAVVYPLNAPGSALYYNPGIPAAREYVQKSILHALKNYDIDAVHLDDYFYPYPAAGQNFPDDDTFHIYGAGFSDKQVWRRHNVNRFVQELSSAIKQHKPWVKFGISPFGVWRNRASDPLGSDTDAWMESWYQLAADSRKWVKQGWLDYIAPQLYWNIGFPPADYEKLLSWWSDVVSATPVHLYIGQADYKTGTAPQPAWQDGAEIARHLRLHQKYPVAGNVHFSAKDLRANRLDSSEHYARQYYSRPALVPLMPHLPGTPPLPPVLGTVEYTDHGAKLYWAAADNRATASQAVSYAVYRFDGSNIRPDSCQFADATHLLATTRSTTYTDSTAVQQQKYTYVVTALDRLHNESRPEGQ